MIAPHAPVDLGRAREDGWLAACVYGSPKHVHRSCHQQLTAVIRSPLRTSAVTALPLMCGRIAGVQITNSLRADQVNWQKPQPDIMTRAVGAAPPLKGFHAHPKEPLQLKTDHKVPITVGQTSGSAPISRHIAPLWLHHSSRRGKNEDVRAAPSAAPSDAEFRFMAGATSMSDSRPIG